MNCKQTYVGKFNVKRNKKKNMLDNNVRLNLALCKLNSECKMNVGKNEFS